MNVFDHELVSCMGVPCGVNQTAAASLATVPFNHLRQLASVSSLATVYITYDSFFASLATVRILSLSTTIVSEVDVDAVHDS